MFLPRDKEEGGWGPETARLAPMLSSIRQRPVSLTGDLQTGTKDADRDPQEPVDELGGKAAIWESPQH